jgi:predicted MFS family arabinose efflux permease
MGKVMGAFSAASVLGVPAGLELARLGGWRAPFFSVAGLGLLVAGAALFLMPPMTGHLRRAGATVAPARSLLRRPAALFSLAATSSAMMSGFLIIPNIAAHLQFDLGYPRAHLGLLYMAGGSVSFLVLRVGGRWVDRAGSARVAAVGTALFLAVLWVGFAFPRPWVPVLPLFVGFMTSNALRNVSTTALSTRVPGPSERARFLSTQSARSTSPPRPAPPSRPRCCTSSRAAASAA